MSLNKNRDNGSDHDWEKGVGNVNYPATNCSRDRKELHRHEWVANSDDWDEGHSEEPNCRCDDVNVLSWKGSCKCKDSDQREKCNEDELKLEFLESVKNESMDKRAEKAKYDENSSKHRSVLVVKPELGT